MTPAEAMEPLIKEAERKGLWLRSHYQHISFSPKELRAEMATGNFRWGPINWELIDPATLMRDPDAEFKAAKQHNDILEKRIRG